MDYYKLLIQRERLSEELKHCKNQKCYRDKKKHYDKLCKEIADYEKFRGIKKNGH